jgi:hypothetical protein
VTPAVRRDGDAFFDSLSVDFADPERRAAGLALIELRPASRSASAVGVLMEDEAAEITTPQARGQVPSDWGAVNLEGVRVADDGERASVALEAGGVGFEIEATRLGGVAFEPGSAFADAAGLTQEVFCARVSGAWHAHGSDEQVRSLGRLVRTSGEVDSSRIELVRSLVVTLEDGALLAVASARPRGAAGHGEEISDARLLDSEGSLRRFEEPLLSTEYDAAGRHRRAGVELWGPDEGAALRGAGTLVGGAAVELGSSDTAFLRFTLDGTPGTARYDLIKAQ